MLPWKTGLSSPIPFRPAEKPPVFEVADHFLTAIGDSIKAFQKPVRMLFNTIRDFIAQAFSCSPFPWVGGQAKRLLGDALIH